ncbi:MAG: SPOR domain-containing protein [Rhodobacteraceae bacterium]|nr:SPOR domain-containing protein [Paracoccaceae bacterium]
MSESRYESTGHDSVDGDVVDAGMAARVTKWVGGGLSLALTLGVIYWAYQLGQRDANDVPVIQAMGGVARERPEDPQGTQADHQGLDVNAVLAGDETVPVGSETQLAPPPQRATAEDQPISEQPSETVLVLPVDEAVDRVEIIEPETGGDPTELAGDPNMTRPARRVVQTGLSPNSDRLSDAIASAIAEANSPTPTPVVETTVAETPSEVSPETPAPLISMPDANATSVAVGTRMIQLGVFDDEESALRNWDLLLANQPDLLNGLQRYIERREAGGRVFYRLRALGFENAEQASTLCAVLMGRDVQCIPVAAR